jgi:hypothetical protein
VGAPRPFATGLVDDTGSESTERMPERCAEVLSLPIPRAMYLVPALLLWTPLSLAGCASLIGLDDLEKTKCAGACPDDAPATGGRSGGAGGAAAFGAVGGTPTGAVGGATQPAPSGGTNDDAGTSNGGTTDGGTAGATNAGATSGAATGGTGGADPGATAGGPSSGGTELGSGGLGGASGTAGQPPASGGGAGIALPIRINFQLSGAPVPEGYVPDTGLTFAAHDQLSFGWNVDHSDVTRDRGVNANQLLDTLCQFHEGGIWELALPNGTYNVLASVGDPAIQSMYTLLVEDVVYWRARSIGANQFLSNTSLITINDGRLTLSQGAAPELATRINYVEISAP